MARVGGVLVALSVLVLDVSHAGDLRMVNRKTVRDINGVLIHAEGTWTVRNPAPDRLNPAVVRIQCTKEHQGWQPHVGPECQEIAASIYPVGQGGFTPDLSFSEFRVQSWTTTELTAMGTAGLCDIASILRINFGEPETATTGGFTVRRYPNAIVTKTRTGPLATDGICGEMAKDYRPYTMVLIGGIEAQASGQLWWPFSPTEKGR
jgi:hypothetical protein